MKKVGITGGIGSGKSTVCKIFEVLGVPVYYADSRAKSLMNEHVEVRNAIIDLLGEQAYQDGILDRKYIASIVFKDKEKLAALNAIVHPAVHKDAADWFASHQDHPYAMQEAALLVENGSYKKFDFLISVSAPQALRIERVMKRDAVSEEEVMKRIKNQLPQEDKDAVADFIIYNDGSASLIQQILHTHNSIIHGT